MRTMPTFHVAGVWEALGTIGSQLVAIPPQAYLVAVLVVLAAQGIGAVLGRWSMQEEQAAERKRRADAATLRLRTEWYAQVAKDEQRRKEQGR